MKLLSRMRTNLRPVIVLADLPAALSASSVAIALAISLAISLTISSISPAAAPAQAPAAASALDNTIADKSTLAMIPLSVRPAGSPFTAGFSVTANSISIADTLVLDLWLVNRGILPATGLFLTLHLPQGLAPIGHRATLSGQPILLELRAGTVIDGLQPWHALFDDPAGQPDICLAPGDSLHERFHIRIAQAGEYAIPTVGAGFLAGSQAMFVANELGLVSVLATGTDCCLLRGNVDGSGGVTIADLTFLIGMLFRDGFLSSCPTEADVDGQLANGSPITIADIAYLLRFLFRDGSPPPPCA